MWIWLFVICAIGMAGFAVYVRLSPVDPERWHVTAYPSGLEKATSNSYLRRIPIAGRDGQEILQKVEMIALSTPKTEVLTGSPEESKVTYVTRSKKFAYPDLTTVSIREDLIEDADGPFLELYARSRFGKSDFGVNRKRVKVWIDALQF